MCGTPLPQRPLTAPGAESTAGFTRHPVEVSQPVPSTSSHLSDLSTPSAVETGVQPAESNGPNYFSQAEQAQSLEQFIAGFHYTPPTEEDEVTMTGAKPTLDNATKYEPAAPISLSDEPSVAEPPAGIGEPLSPPAPATEVAPSAESIVEQPPLVASQPPPFATKGIREQPPDRSRFLDDLSAPVNEAPPPTTGPSIAGPSFLGLSDTPATPAYIADDAERQSHWRAWTAIIVICIFAGLGFLEWRAEKNQSSNGPIGIMKMQIERLKGKRAVITPPPSSEAATGSAQPGATAQPAGAGPQMQLAPQQKPQTSNPQPAGEPKTTLEKQTNPGAASNASVPPVTKAQSASTLASSTTATVAAGGSKPQTPSAKPESAKSTNAAVANNPLNSAAPSAESTESQQEKATKTTAPGAEELAKAAKASDSAAASAWLWKAVAKGNPEAPVKLANLYIKGDGVAQSCDQATVLLRSAAADGNAAARSRLGSLYASGTCVPRNRVRAYQYMSQALEANPNAVWPRQFREQLWTQMTPQERQQVQP
jgi:hypothetical protein